MSKSQSAICVAFTCALLFTTPLTAAEKTLTAVTALQKNNTIARSFLVNFVDVVNKKGKGLIQIKYIGGQEVVPPQKSASALKRGQFDVLNAPSSYYSGTVPEALALLAANQGPRQLRKNGAWKQLQEIWQKKAGAHLLAWGENMTSYNMYLSEKPPMRPDGLPDLTGLKMRATGTYRPLFRALGATTVNIKSSEILNAMQRGTVKGFGFTDVSIVDLGFHKVAKFRVTPNFYQTNQVVTFNKGIWDSLTQEQRDFLEKEALEYETTSIMWVEKERLDQEKKLKAEGVVDVELKGAAADKYLDIAHQEMWKELEKKAPGSLAKLRDLMYVPGKPNRQADLKSATERLRQ